MSKEDQACQCTSVELGSKTLKLLQRPPELKVPQEWLKIEPNWTKNPKLKIQLRNGLFGKIYDYDGMDYTVHQFWLDDAMVCRVLRCFVIIRSRERIRPHFRGLDAPVRHREAYLCLQHHCYEHCRGFMNYLSEGTSSTMWEECEKPEDDEHMATEGLFHMGLRIEPVWEVLTTERRLAYHRRFIAMDKMLPPESGDFWFAIDQIRYATEIRFDECLYPTERYDGDGREMTDQEIENDFFFYSLDINRQPRIMPFNTRRHKVEFFLPVNYLLSRTPAQRRRLLANQIQLEERNIMIPRMPIIEVEKEASRRQRLTPQLPRKLPPPRMVPIPVNIKLPPPLALNTASTAHPPVAKTKKKSPPQTADPNAVNGIAEPEQSAPPPAQEPEAPAASAPPPAANMLRRTAPKSNKKRKKKK